MKTLTEPKAAIAEFLERFGEALSLGDLDRIIGCWAIPCFIVADEGGSALNSRSQIEAFFGGAKETYRTMGILATRPEIQEFKELTHRLFDVTVRWPGFDEEGNERWSERSHYVIREDIHHGYQICVAVMLGGRKR